MSLVKPISLEKPSFDATKNEIFEFISKGGNQVVKNRLTIRNNDNNEIVYQKKIESFKFSHEVPSNTLENGKYYNYYFNTYDINDSDDSVSESPDSNIVSFWCYSKPILSIKNMPLGNKVETATYEFIIEYNQLEGELLDFLNIELYDAKKELVSKSENLYNSSKPPVLFNYTFSGLENNSEYSILINGMTTNRTIIKSDFINFSVQYVKPMVYSKMNLTNKCHDGYVQVSTNLLIVNGEVNPDPPIYVKELEREGLEDYVKWEELFTIKEDKIASNWVTPVMIDLSNEGSFVRWYEGFNINKNFVLSIWMKPSLLSDFCKLWNSKTNTNFKIRFLREVPYNMTEVKDCFELIGEENGQIKVHQRSNYVDIINGYCYLMIWIKKIDNNYELGLDVIKRGEKNYSIWGGQDAIIGEYITLLSDEKKINLISVYGKTIQDKIQEITNPCNFNSVGEENKNIEIIISGKNLLKNSNFKNNLDYWTPTTYSKITNYGLEIHNTRSDGKSAYIRQYLSDFAINRLLNVTKFTLFLSAYTDINNQGKAIFYVTENGIDRPLAIIDFNSVNEEDKYVNISEYNLNKLENAFIELSSLNYDKKFYIKNIQLELGDNKTSYEEYQEKNINISISKPLFSIDKIKDRLLKNNGEFKILRKLEKILINGTENWTISKNSNNFYTSDLVLNLKGKSLIINNRFIKKDGDYSLNRTSPIDGIIINNDGNLRFCFDSNININSVENLKKWLNDNNIEIIYELKTSYYEEILEQDVFNNLTLLENTTNIYVNDKVNADISLYYNNKKPLSNLEFNKITDINWENESYKIGKEFIKKSDNINISPIDNVLIKNGIFDNLDISEDINKQYNIEFPKWTYYTKLNCNFNGNIKGGNIEYTLSQLDYIKIKRREIGSFEWITLKQVKIEKIDDLYITLNDSYIPNNTEFQYAVVPVLNGNIEGEYILDTIITQLNGVFISDDTKIFKLYNSVLYNGTTNTNLIGILNPIGREYPILIENSNVNYEQGSITATFLGYEYEKSRQIDRKSVVTQTNDFINFMRNKKAKILSDWNGNIKLIRLSASQSISYNSNYGNGITTVTFNWVEQGKYNKQLDLYNNGLLDIIE